METQDFNKKLLDYLYGEMTSNEKKEFEKKLNEDAALQKEYEDLVQVRKELDNLKDKEVMEPFSAQSKSSHFNWFNPGYKGRMVVFRPVTAVAASLLILMLFGYLTNFSISINSQGFQLGYGVELSTDEQNYISKEDVKTLVEQEVMRSNQKLTAQLKEAEDNYNNKMIAFESTLNSVKNLNRQSSISDEDLQNFLRRTENNNTETIKEYLKLTSNQQQEYFKEMFTQFNNYYRAQRDDDLAFIQNSLFEINQQQVIQKQETDQAIASLYTSVNKAGN